jgi:iron(III) transport system ATP-binding protein
VALARALAPRPAVVLLDEPFSSLDAALRETTRRAVADALDASKTTTILVTHDQAEALSMADQVAVMQAGQFVQTATPTELYRAPVDAYTAEFVGDAMMFSADIRDGIAICELGRLPVDDRAFVGPATVLVRPEQVLIDRVAGDGAIRASVTAVTFYGHEAIAHLLLASGTVITSRVPGHLAPTPHREVHVAVDGSVHVFRRPASRGAD